MWSWTAALASTVTLGLVTPGMAAAQTAPPLAVAAAELLQLEVSINHQPTGLIGSFERSTDGAIWATGDELHSLGLKAPAGPARQRLDALSGVTAVYDPKTQAIDITAPNSSLIPHLLSARAPVVRGRGPQSSVGALLNYSLVLAAGQDGGKGHWSPSVGEGEFEARAFGPFGLFTTTLYAQVSAARSNAVRLDSAWIWSDSAGLRTWRAGDLISGGFDWTRPVRLGGFQIRRDFALRPDLVTMPSPSLSSSAAVPSMAEVLVNGAPVMSTNVQSGPLQVRDLPVLQGPTNTQLILKDSYGRQVVAYAGSFYATPQMLAPGLVDYSIEGGFARRYFAVQSQNYDGNPAASASLRYGVTDWDTLQLHTEGGAGLVLAGVGQVIRVGGLGVVNLSGAASTDHGKSGAQLGVGGQTQIGLFTAGAQLQATVGRYMDLGAATAALNGTSTAAAGVLPPQRLIQANLSFPVSALRLWSSESASAGFGLSAISDKVTGNRQVWSFTFRQPVGPRANVYLQAFTVPGEQRSGGLFFGLSIPLGGHSNLMAGAERDGSTQSAYAEVSHQSLRDEAALNWRVRLQAGERQGVEGEADYQGRVGEIDLLAQDEGGLGSLQARAAGSLVVMGGGLFAAPRIEDAFAVIDAGQPNVAVSYENRDLGHTNGRGLLIAPRLTADVPNHLSIDPDALSAEVTVESIDQIVVPATGSGVLVRFKLGARQTGVLLTLTDASGAVLPVASQGQVVGRQAPFLVGYDGQAFLADVDASTVLTVTLPSGKTCQSHLSQTHGALNAGACR
jgi:outer membrane usher protein